MRTGATVGIVLAAGLLQAVVATSAVGQTYLKPVPTASGVRIDARSLADEDAARALGIPLAQDMPALTHGGGVHVTGARAVFVVLGRFSDTGEPGVTADRVQAEMFTGSAGGSTLSEFYEDQSGGAFTVTGDVSAWLQTDVSLFDAAGSLEGHGSVGDSVDVHVARLLDQLDPDVDFGEFDNDGPDGMPNSGDDDGRVDLLSVKYAEVGGHCGGPGPWPHFGGLRVDGGPYATDDATPGGANIEIPVYIMDSVVECDGVTPQSMAVTAHELGHSIGLPDYYRAVNGIEAGNRHWAAGCFDLMGAGAWGCGGGALPTDGFGPAGLSAFSRWTLGWAELQEITVADDETFVLEPLITSGHALRVRLAPESPESPGPSRLGRWDRRRFRPPGTTWGASPRSPSTRSPDRVPRRRCDSPSGRVFGWSLAPSPRTPPSSSPTPARWSSPEASLPTPSPMPSAGCPTTSWSPSTAPRSSSRAHPGRRAPSGSACGWRTRPGPRSRRPSRSGCSTTPPSTPAVSWTRWWVPGPSPPSSRGTSTGRGTTTGASIWATCGRS